MGIDFQLSFHSASQQAFCSENHYSHFYHEELGLDGSFLLTKSKI